MLTSLKRLKLCLDRVQPFYLGRDRADRGILVFNGFADRLGESLSLLLSQRSPGEIGGLVGAMKGNRVHSYQPA